MALRAIKDFPKAAPSTEDLILIEQQGGGRSTPLSELPVSTPVSTRIAGEVNTLNSRIDNIMASSGDDISEIVDARQGSDRTNYASLKARLDAENNQLKGDLDKVVTFEVSPNLLDTDNFINNKYLYEGVLYDSDNLFVTDYIPVVAGDILHYQWTDGNTNNRFDSVANDVKAFRFVEGYNAKKEYVTGSVKSNMNSFTVEDGVCYVRATIDSGYYNNSTYYDCAIVKYTGVVYPYYPYDTTINAQLSPLLIPSFTKEQKSQYKGLSAAVIHKLDFVCSCKPLAINAIANFDEDFTSFVVGLRDTKDVSKMRVTVDSTNITLYDAGYGVANEVTYAHGLTIKNNLAVKIVSSNNETYNISIQSMGVEYKTPAFYPTKSTLVTPYCSLAMGGTSTVDITASCPHIYRDTWIFGDSYFGYSESRWMFYLLTKDKPTNLMVDGFGGETSVNSIKSFKTLLKIGTPKTVVWCLGMNDGSDGAEPSANWMNTINELLDVCNKSGIKLVLATIPSVPSINHEKKNEWVRNSGYQYIDFASAVGASASGVWYDGMLSSDNVHPSVTGALTLYYQAITDCPLLLEN